MADFGPHIIDGFRAVYLYIRLLVDVINYWTDH